MTVALDIQNLRKRYGDHQAVAGLSLQVKSGELYALLGPNGAGKTTTLRMVAGLLKPDQGDVHISGHSIVHTPQIAKQHLAYLPDEPLLYGKLKALEYLEFVAGLWGIRPEEAAAEATRLLQLLGLWEVRLDLCETFSRGMKQKLALIAAFIHHPRVVILDEPLMGLDAAAARLVKDQLVQYVAQGNAVVLTTHIMEIAERMAHRIGIINRGHLIAEGSLEELRARSGEMGGTLESVFLELTDEQRLIGSQVRE